jgi:glycosyltransferase involved in cell wall biosynthesis
MKKVLILGHYPPPAIGPAVATKIISESRLKEKFDLHIFKTNTSNINHLGKFMFSKVLINFKMYVKFFFLLKSTKFNLLLVPVSQTTIGYLKDSIFLLIGRMYGIKIITQLRGSNWVEWLKSSNGFLRFYVKKTMRLAMGGIVLGEKLKYLFEDYYSVDRIFSIPNGAKIYAKDKILDSSSKYLRILYLSNLQPSKGIINLIDSIKILNDLKLKIKLTVVGRWRDEKTQHICLKKCEKYNLPVNFDHSVNHEDKYKYYNNADIFVFTPNKPEGHPWVIVEAIGSGLPVITTDRGAITDSVIDLYNGYVVELNSPEAIASRIKKFYYDRNLIKTMGSNSRLHYEKKFTEEILVKNYSDCFEKVLRF